MQIVYGKTLSKEEVLLINKIATECGIMFDTARLLFVRNVNTVEKAKRFLSPSRSHLNDPFLFNDMQKVVERIKQAKENNQRVLIFGDYDADGICSVTILYYCLKEYGITPIFAIPEREDGYGLNEQIILQIHEQNPIDLVITVDCGISDGEKIENLKNNGIEVIVTDHHEPSEVLPQTLIVNPKVKGENYPFDGLSGAGVAYKLGCALIGNKADEYLDFVALSTLADSMPLIEENRDIVYLGLKKFSSNKIRPLFKYLVNDVDKQVNSQTLVYQIAPRVNAGGRMGDALSVLRLFTCEEENEIYDLAVLLNTYNINRQAESERVFREAKAQILANGITLNPVICVKGDDWNSGVLGIVSAKLVEEYNRPVIVFAKHGDNYKGSARTIDSVNIHAVLTSVQDYTLGFGGHSQAAGISVESSRYDDFYTALITAMNEFYRDVDFTKTISAEWEMTSPVSLEFAKEIDLLEPFGTGNKKPVFTTKVNQIYAQPLKSGSPHYSFSTNAVNMLLFNGESQVETLSYPVDKTVFFELNLSSFRGKDSVKGFVKNIIPDYSDFSQMQLYLLSSQLRSVINESDNFSTTNFDQEIVQGGYGTLYVLSNLENLNKYPNLHNLCVSPFVPQSFSGQNAIVVAPSYIPEVYNNVVYLDTPLAVLQTNAKVKVVKDLSGIETLKDLQTERGFFAGVFARLCEVNRRPFFNAVHGYENYGEGFDANSFVFAVEVFLELGIFKIENGCLVRYPEVKNALTNSKIYSKILSIKQ